MKVHAALPMSEKVRTTHGSGDRSLRALCAALARSPDGSHLASGGNDNTVRVFRGLEPSPVRELTQHTAAVKVTRGPACRSRAKTIARSNILRTTSST